MYETQKRQEWEKRLDVVETMVELSRFHAITHVTNASWCAEVNATVHSEICAVPDERLAEERTVLKDLPSLRPEIGTGSVRRKVDRLSCIRYGSARYSVPTRLVGATVAVVVDHGALIVLEPATGVIVAEHELVGPGEASILDEHYDGPGQAPSRGPRPKTPAEKQFCALGEEAEQFLVGAAAIGNTFRFQVRMLSGRSTYGAGVKRDPADHLCVAGELLPAQPVGDRWAIRGELVELSR